MGEPAARRSRKVSLRVELPDELVRVLAPSSDEAAACLKRLALIDLFRQGRVSSGYAAETLGVSRSQFIDLLAEHGVPYIDLSAEELQQDLEAARRLRERLNPSSSSTAGH